MGALREKHVLTKKWNCFCTTSGSSWWSLVRPVMPHRGAHGLRIRRVHRAMAVRPFASSVGPGAPTGPAHGLATHACASPVIPPFFFFLRGTWVHRLGQLRDNRSLSEAQALHVSTLPRVIKTSLRSGQITRPEIILQEGFFLKSFKCMPTPIGFLENNYHL